ncbi:lactate utilization protein C [Allohahella marinimesophila]|uniref:LUD domain-containing protein n=1 Tax=Allohahella marinimesophila TaxID=1054972 RepID=A0ABP7NL59_9GAMM
MSDSEQQSARERILDRLTTAQPETAPADNLPMTPSASESDSSARPRSAKQQRQLVSQLADALLASHAEVLHVREDDWPHTLATLAQAEQLRTWLCHPACEAGRMFSTYIGDRQPGALKLRHYSGEYPLPADQAGTRQWPDKAALFHNIDAGLSHATAGIADTGTLLLFSSPTQPRLLSLVPPVHAVTLRYSAIQSNMAECMATNAVFRQRPLPANIIFVSGPSKTADIQQTLAYGAHGPKRLIVMLIDDLAQFSSTSS